MFELEKTFYFEAGHLLDHHDGKCRNPHGHSYSFTLYLRTNELVKEGPKKNMVIDFSMISEIVKPMIENYLDHKWLNDSLECDSPTSEFIAKWIYERLSGDLPNLYAVAVCETSSTRTTYSPLPCLLSMPMPLPMPS